MLKNSFARAVVLIAVALVLAIVTNGFASRTRRLVLKGFYPDALHVPAPPPVATPPVATATVATATVEPIATPDDRGEPVVDDSFYILFNAHYEPLTFRLPTNQWGDRWTKVLDTNEPVPDLRLHQEWKAGDEVSIEAYAMMVLQRLG